MYIMIPLQCSDTVGHLACKKLGVDLFMVTIWSSAHLIAAVVTTTSVIVSSNKI